MLRRHLVRAVLLVLVLGSVRAAWADVRPPVEVFITGSPRAAVKDQSFEGTFQFSAGAPLQLSNLTLSGAGWTVENAGALSATLQAGEKVEVAFTAKPTDPGKPLVLTYDVGGITMQKEFDLSPESVDRILKPGKVAVRGPVDPMAKPADARLAQVPPLALPKAVSEATLRKQAGQPARSGEEHVEARWIRVHGRFLYTRSDAANIGAYGVAVRIYDDDSPFGSELLANVVTDGQGWYDVSFYWDPCAVFCDAQPDIYIVFSTENTEYTVKSTAFLAGAYAWQTGTVSDYTGSDLDFGWLWPGPEGDQPAVHIMTTLVRGWNYHVSNGFDMSSMNAYWPEGGSGAYYNGNVHFSTGEQWIEGTINHEQGHHWVDNFGVVVGPDYCNGICDGPSGCGHCVWCQETDHDAWAEGFPNWLGELIPGTFLSWYGTAAVALADGRYNLESLGTCGSTADPYRTENFLGALLHDIQDTPSDDHNLSDAWRDRLALGVGPIFTIADLDGPTTPANFLTKFVARYPGYTENFWETAKNCGYDFDVFAPGVVSGLTSTSHSAGGNSPDPTVDLIWNRASDDASGVGGYSIYISTGGPVIPDGFQDIGNVTAYTTSTLPPGTYWFNIRAIDRDGRVSAGYAAFGPFTIRTPLPANLTTYTFGGWAYPLVPRNAADATFTSVPAPSALDGNSSTTYWSMGGWNSGEQSTGGGFQGRLYVDDIWYWWFGWGAIGAGGGYYGTNGGPMWVPGGRHTFEVVHDALDEIAETNEGDNAWAHQWVWSPLDINPAGLVTRAAPNYRTAGWSSVVDGSPVYYNSDGLRFLSDGFWNAVTIRSLDETEDYDLRLHNPSTGPTNGFDSYLQWSGRVAALDAVLVNENMVGYAAWDVSAINWSGGSSNYVTEHVRSIYLSQGPTYSFTMGAGESMDLYEFYVGAAGPISMVVQVTDPNPDATPLQLHWLDKTFTTGQINTYSAAGATDATGKGRIDANITNTGYHCLAVFREYGTGTQPLNYTVRIMTTPPDFVPYTAAGWYSPFVPRNAFDGTGVSVPAPALLTGDAASTYFNFGNINASPTGAPSLYQQAYLDGVYGWWLAWGGYGPGAVGLFNWDIPWTVRGGRHTLSTIEDPNNDQEEISETNNAYGTQWVWQPTTLALNSTTTRAAPSERAGGWDQGFVGTLWWNCDGIRTPAYSPGGSGYWGALALMPTGLSDFDPRLHELSTGAQDGFTSALAQSYWLSGQSDYVLVNFNMTGFRAFDVGVVKYGSGSDNYVAQALGAPYLATNPRGTYGPFSVAGGRIMNLHEVYLAAGTWEVDVIPGAGNPVDWGLTLHPRDLAYQQKSTSVGGAVAWLNDASHNESVIVTVPTTGFYCVAVWKSTNADLNRTGTYRLQFNGGLVDVPETTANAAAFRGAFPNPLRSRTRLEFELPAEQSASLEIFDLNGARVRTLVSGHWPGGLNTVEWRGDDDEGRQVHAGVYYARFRSGHVLDRRKLVKLD